MENELEYALWLIPDAAIGRKLRKIIARLAEEYDSPVFDPHVTLLSRFRTNRKNAIRRSDLLMKDLRVFPITLSGFGIGKTYFQCVLVRAKRTAGIIAANRKAQKIFGVRQKYVPHASLVYGNFSRKVRMDIAKGLKFPKSSFDARTIHLIEVRSANPDDWHVIRRFRLA